MAQEVAAAGAVVWRPTGQHAVKIALVHRPRYDDWSLPKGKLDEWESSRAAAMREVAEETGLRAALGRFLGQVRYPVDEYVKTDARSVPPASKTVDYYAARALDGRFAPSDEVDEMRWCSIHKARKLLTYQHDREIVAKFAALPPALTTLLLVRHAKAGSRSHWHDADDLRPLSENGQRQVPPVRALAALYGVDRVYSAPLERCVQTVRPVADELGTKVIEEAVLAEKTYPCAEKATKRRLLEIVAEGGVPLVCSQGRVIPDLVSRVAGAAGLPLRHVESKKGSVWALFFAEGTLVAADYIAVP